jgi:thioredoxin 1
MTDIRTRFWHGNRSRLGALVTGVKNLQRFDGPTFEADVLQASEPVVVDFYADWCPPCKMMEPVVEQLAEEFAGKVKIGELNTDDNQEIAIRYGIMGIPTLGMFRDGKLVDRMVGFPGAGRVRTWIAQHAPTVETVGS